MAEEKCDKNLRGNDRKDKDFGKKSFNKCPRCGKLFESLLKLDPLTHRCHECTAQVECIKKLMGNPNIRPLNYDELSYHKTK